MSESKAPARPDDLPQPSAGSFERHDGGLWYVERGKKYRASPDGLLAFELPRSLAPWLPAAWLEVWFVPLGITPAHAVAFDLECSRRMDSYEEDQIYHHDEYGHLPTPGDYLSNARLLAHKLLGGGRLPPLPIGDLFVNRCIPHLVELIRLLDLQAGPDGGTPEGAEGAAPGAASAPKKARAKMGRKPDTDLVADQRLYDAWRTGPYGTYADLAREMGLKPKDVSDAIDRVRHRRRKK